MVFNIHIQINRLSLYQVNVSNSLSNKVFLDEPYDELSRKFNRSTHKINYTVDDYNPEDYVLCLDDPNAWYYYYIIYLYKPEKKIISVEIFFQSNDKDKRYPLIFGFNFVDDTSAYYTYYHLRGLKKKTGSIGTDGLIKKEDLITRLIDERGLYVSESYNKFIIRLGDKPSNTPVEYPKSGKNKGRITIKKSDVPDPPNYVKYEHEINRLNNVHSFYIAFHQDTLYMIGESSFGKLQHVDVYFNKHNGDKPLIFVFTFERRITLYKFPDFKSDIPNKTKNISKLEAFNSNYLVKTLKEVYKEVHKEITFKIGQGKNQHISETAHRFYLNKFDEFRRVILRPNLDEKNGGSKRGPYVVFKDSLLTKAKVKKIDSNPFSDINDFKFESIYVYYTTHYEALLIVFIGEYEKKYYRLSKGGKTWQKESAFNFGNDFELIPKLRIIEDEKNAFVQVPGTTTNLKAQTGRSPSKAQKTDVKKPQDHKFPQLRPEIPEKEVFKGSTIPTVQIDLSVTKETTYGSSPKITVQSKSFYSSLQLFCYFTHSISSNQPFKIVSFKTGDRRFITVDRALDNIISLNAYFNSYDTQKPIMLELTTSKKETKYYVNIIQNEPTYLFSSFTEVKNEEIIYKMIAESDRVNKTLTYQLEKSFKSDGTSMYGLNNTVKVIKKVQDSNGFTKYTHEPKNGKSIRSYVLLDGQVLLPKNRDLKPEKWDIQNKNYKNLNVYVLNSDPKTPLLIELNEDKKKPITYVCKKDGSGKYWEKEDSDISNDEKIGYKLLEINYPMKKSVIIELDKNAAGDYDMRLIDNSLNYSTREYDKKAYKEGMIDSNNKIKVELTSSVLDSKQRHLTDYKFFSHNIPVLNNSLGVAGIRIFLPRTGGTQLEEITLFDKDKDVSQPQNKLFLYYPPKTGLNKIYGYFYGSDSRPLLLCYDTHLYKRVKDNDSTKWVLDKKIKCWESSEVLELLRKVHGTMKRKLTFLKTGNLQNITVSREENVGSFKRIRFTANTQVSLLSSSFTLPESELIKELNKTTSISTLLDGLKDRQFDSVNIYFEQTRSTTFLVEFIDESIKKHFQRVDKLGEYWLDKLVEYKADHDLKDKLSQIQSTFNSIIVYEIDKIATEYNTSIKIDEDHDFESDEFIGYRHYYSSNQANLSLILYGNKPLITKDSRTGDILTFTDLETKPFKDITVYFGNKAKVKDLGFGENVPLVIVFHSSGINEGSTFYYRHRRDSTGHYWEPVSNLPFVEGAIDLLSILRETEFDFLKSLVILTDFKTTYGEEEIKSAISNLNVKGHILEANIDNKSLTVVDKVRPQCFYKSGFKYIEYNINRIKEDEWYGLRFFIRDNTGTKYNELSFHPFFSFLKEYLIHKRDANNNKVYVFFYGDDPRPLLISYGKVGFRPNSTSEYETSWYRLDEDIDFESCISERNNLVEPLSEVVGILNEVNLAHRPSPTNQREPNRRGNETKEYNLHSYNNKTFKASVSYRNMNCYRAYKHEPIGLGSNGSGFRLGNIKYNDSRFGNLEYDLTKQLYGVSIYYSLHDILHQFPLLIELNFRNDANEFFMAGSKYNDFWFSLNKNQHNSLLKYFRDSDIDNFEYGLYQIRQDLGINFNSDSKEYLFDPEKCEEDNNKTTIITATSSTLGTVATGGTIVGVTAATRPEWFIPVIRALV